MERVALQGQIRALEVNHRTIGMSLNKLDDTTIFKVAAECRFQAEGDAESARVFLETEGNK